MQTLTPAERSALKARAHHLNPVVMIGEAGVTPAMLKEIDIALKSHELIKIRGLGDDRERRGHLDSKICVALSASPVQHIGKILTTGRGPSNPRDRNRSWCRAAAANRDSAQSVASRIDDKCLSVWFPCT
ncbi:MAG: YhbY family RNA-binding protein [Burkholderiales bacterium]|nr:YhbY family RNA-binding protein [Burkholderiales bacterium]